MIANLSETDKDFYMLRVSLENMHLKLVEHARIMRASVEAAEISRDRAAYCAFVCEYAMAWEEADNHWSRFRMHVARIAKYKAELNATTKRANPIDRFLDTVC